MAISYRFACRRRTAASWTSLNEVLLKGEIGLETDTNKFKFGNGVLGWNDLEYAGDLSNITPPGENKIVFWNVGIGAWDLLSIGTNLFISGSTPTLDATGGGGTSDSGGSGTADSPFIDTAWDALPLFLRGCWAWLTITPGPSGNSSLFGVTATHFSQSVSSTASQTIATTSTFTRQVRIRYTSAAGAGSLASNYGNVAWLCGSGGFFYAWRGGNSDAALVANARWFAGLRAAVTAPTNADPSSLVNIIGFGADTGDANMQFMHNDGSGTATKIDLGASFPANTRQADFYEFRLWSLAGSGQVFYHARNVATGATAHNIGSPVSSNLPSATQLLSHGYWRNNGTTALAVAQDFGGWMMAYNLEG